MENKNTKIILLVFLIFLLLGIFYFKKTVLAITTPIIISAIQTSGKTTDDDFIELYNNSCKDIELTGWKILKKTKEATKPTSIGTLKKFIPAKGYFLWKNTKTNINGDPDYETKTYYLANDYSLALFDKNDRQIDSITWGENQNPFPDTIKYQNNLEVFEALKRNTDNKFSLEKNYSPKNSTFIEEKELAFCLKDDPPTEKTYSDKIYINELFPAPSSNSDKEEFIELYNPDEKDNDISDWILRDSSKSGKYVFPKDTKIKATDFFVIYKKEFKFALNNSGEEKVFLLDPTEKEIAQVSYSSSAKTDYSYAFNGSDWHWTPHFTPGKENIFAELLSSKINKDKKIYADVYANFEAAANKKTKKFTWDFGDGHKSYLQKTKHKYEKADEYDASLKISGDGEDNLIKFKVKVEKFGKPKVRIISLSANPIGKDTKNEWLEIINKTNKKINLKNWSIASGWKKLSNHPIRKDFILKPGKSKKLINNICAFSLGNEKAKIELRYPDGKIADKIQYERKKDPILEDELYQKIEKSGWIWRKSPSNVTISSVTKNPPEILSTPVSMENIETTPPNIELLTGTHSTKNPHWQIKQREQLLLLFAKSKIDSEKFITKNPNLFPKIRLKSHFISINMGEKSTDYPFSLSFFWKILNTRLNQIILKF
jgi:hypothetical protein